MIRVERHLSRTIPGLAVILAALAIGCGGGGGGGGRSQPALISGGSSSGGSVDPTAGGITTGGTTGAAVTTGSGGPVDSSAGSFDPTTGSLSGGTVDPTTGTVDPTSGGVTDPTTGTSDPTTGSTVDPTTGTATSGTVDPTTGSSTTGTVDPTTGTSDPTTGSGATDPTTGTIDPTTGSGSTGSSAPTVTPVTGGDPTAGGTAGGSTLGNLLRPNAIYFGHYVDASVVSSVRPDGSERLDQGGSMPNVTAAIADPNRANGFVYAATVDGRIGVYRGTSFTPSAAQQLAPPTFDYVSALQATANGGVVMVASRGGSARVYLLENGSVTDIDRAEDVAVSLDGSRIAYTQSVGSYSDLYLWSRGTGVSTRLDTGGDAILPSFSKDGAWILFSSLRDRTGSGTAAYDLYQVPSSGGAVERITNTPNVDELGACYNEARTLISYVSLGADPASTGVFVLSNLGTTRVAADSDVSLATYWTDSSGRSRGRQRGARFQRLPAVPRHSAKRKGR